MNITMGNFMIEITENLWVGTQRDFEERHYLQKDNNESSWAFLHAAKEPYHRQFLGYTGRAAPKESEEYLWALRGNRLALNLVDAPDPKYIPATVIDRALDFLAEQLMDGKKVLLHCNMGASRAPSIGLLYLNGCAQLMGNTPGVQLVKFEEAEKYYKDNVYSGYAPGEGMRGFMNEHWEEYL